LAHYINNRDFLAAIIERKGKLKEAADQGKEPPIISNYLGECIMKIATHLSYKPNFMNYSYRDDMILDGIENCIIYFDNFDPTKSSNPFSYFTQIVFYAFLRRLQKEKKQSYIRGKLINDMSHESFETQDHDDGGEYHNSYIEFMQQHGTFDDSFIKNKESKKKKKVSPLDRFIIDGTEDV